MAQSGLLGPYRLNFDGIHAAIGNTMPGVFALGHLDGQGRFCVSRVGRSDNDVRATLCDFIGSDNFFKFDVMSTSRAAFEKECSLFHDFSPRGNLVHPARPPQTDWTCPHCRTLSRW
jgi:hypothetical protein